VSDGDDSVVGKLGRVTHAIVADRPGEVVVHIRGGTEVYMAVGDSDLPLNSQVLVVGQLSSRTVQVTAFTGGVT
jgi:membrane protein implicated in regulation of membrane protease activity